MKNNQELQTDVQNAIKWEPLLNGAEIGVTAKDDGLYSSQQVTNLQNIIGLNNLKYLENCSHSVFIDQQTQFIDAVITWTK